MGQCFPRKHTPSGDGNELWECCCQRCKMKSQSSENLSKRLWKWEGIRVCQQQQQRHCETLAWKKEEGQVWNSVSYRKSSRRHGNKSVPAPSDPSSGCSVALHRAISPTVCSHDGDQLVQTNGGEKKSLTRMHLFYELLMADSISFSAVRLSEKDFKHCIVQHSNTCKDTQLPAAWKDEVGTAEILWEEMGKLDI